MYQISILCENQEKYEEIMKHMERAFLVKKDIRKPTEGKNGLYFFAEIEPKEGGGRPEKLTELQKKKIIEALVAGKNKMQLSREYGVSRSTINRIQKGFNET